MPGPEVRPVSHDPAARPDEQPAPGRDTELLDVVARQRDELRVNRDGTGLAGRSVLERLPVARLAAVRPPGAATQFGVRQPQLAPAVIREAHEVIAAQVHRFLYSQPGVVQTAKNATMRSQRLPCARTASRSRRAWSGLATTRRSSVCHSRPSPLHRVSGLTGRMRRSHDRAEPRTIDDLIGMIRRHKLSQARNIGRPSITEIRTALIAEGFDARYSELS